MSNHDTPSTQALIERYYQEERAQKLREQTLADVNLKIEPADLALLTVLSKRFNKSREEVLKDLTASALTDLFSAIEANERKLLARDADDQARSIADAVAEDNGVKEVESKPNFWTQLDKTLVRQEKKRQKEMQQAKSKGVAEKTVSTSSDAANTTTNHSNSMTSNQADQTAELVEPTQISEVGAIEPAPKAIESQAAMQESDSVAETVPSMSVFSE